MRIAFLGNFSQPFCTEVHLAATMESMGHTVSRLQENTTDPNQLINLVRGHDLFWFVRTWGETLTSGHLIRIQRLGIPTVSYHLDLYVGLQREAGLPGDPFWYTDYVFTPDGSVEAAEVFDRLGINHHFMWPAVYRGGCYMARPEPRRPRDVVFVGGGKDYGHPEWPYRRQLIEWLEATYGRRFRKYGGPEGTVREAALNQLYADTKVVVGDSVNLRGWYSCVDTETEALTESGWKPYHEIEVGENVYTINPDSMLGEWQPVLAVNVHDGPAALTSIETSSHSSMTTPDHKWFVESSSTHREYEEPPLEACPECGWVPTIVSPERLRPTMARHRSTTHGVVSDPPTPRATRTRRFRTTDQIGPNDRIPIAAPCANLPTVPKFSDALVEIVAWLWTEGSVSQGRYKHISQSHRVNGSHVASIRAALAAEFGPPSDVYMGSKGFDRSVPSWRERPREIGITYFLLNQAASDLLWDLVPNCVVPSWFIASLTASQLDLFIHKSLDADGSRSTSAPKPGYEMASTSACITQADPERLDAFEMACALRGLATNRYTIPGGAGTDRDRPQYVVRVKKRQSVAPLRQTTKTAVSYPGKVWCPTTPNGTWLARRRGSVWFTGNSDRIFETIGRGGFIIYPRIDGLDQLFTDGENVVFYEYGDFDRLRYLIDHYIESDAERLRIRKAGFEHVKAHHTYHNRLGDVFAMLAADGAI